MVLLNLWFLCPQLVRLNGEVGSRLGVVDVQRLVFADVWEFIGGAGQGEEGIVPGRLRSRGRHVVDVVVCRHFDGVR